MIDAKRVVLSHLDRESATNFHEHNTNKETKRQVLNRYKGSERTYFHVTKGVPENRGNGKHTQVPKIGINPGKNSHNPMGIYAYDVNSEGVYRSAEDLGSYVYIIKSKASMPLFDLGSQNLDDYAPIVKKLRDKLNHQIKEYGKREKETGSEFKNYKPGDFIKGQKTTDGGYNSYFIKEDLKRANHTLQSFSKDGTEDMYGKKTPPISPSKYGSTMFDLIKGLSGGSASKQTKIWMECGVKAGLSDPGLGVLDNPEDPAQVVFFSTSAFLVLEVAS